MKQYQIDFANGCAIEKCKNRIKRFTLFTDKNTLYISDRAGIVHITAENSEVM